jgi:hypothetical protein
MRQTDLLVRIAPWLNMSSIELQQASIRVLNTEYKDYDDFLKRYGQLHSEKPEQMAILSILNYLEGIGILVRRKLVDADFVFDFWSGDIPYAMGESEAYHRRGEKKMELPSAS